MHRSFRQTECNKVVEVPRQAHVPGHVFRRDVPLPRTCGNVALRGCGDGYFAAVGTKIPVVFHIHSSGRLATDLKQT